MFGNRGYQSTIVNPGDSAAPIRLEVRGESVRPVISCDTTGQKIIVNRTVGKHDLLVLNTETGKRRVEIYRNGSSIAENAFGYIDPASTIDLEIPTGRSEWTYTSGDDSTDAFVQLSYYPRYIGG